VGTRNSITSCVGPDPEEEPDDEALCEVTVVIVRAIVGIGVCGGEFAELAELVVGESGEPGSSCSASGFGETIGG
jgi:hypothetical protein